MLLNSQGINIAIVDDHPIVIEGLKNLLQMEPAFNLQARFSSGSGLMSYLEDNEVDVVLLDITLPDGNGVHFCKEVRKKHPDIKILAISNLSERSVIRQMLQSGASGYLLKTAEAKDILQCIWQAINGETALSNEIREILSLPGLDNVDAIPDLTKREKHILQLLAEGNTSAEIAATLFISPLTVKTHRATLFQKFNVGNLITLLNRAKQYGLLQ